jgi:hypothetical protein
MEAIYKANANEPDISLVKAIKNLFKGKEVTIIVSSEMDETLPIGNLTMRKFSDSFTWLPSGRL